jgi:hypothetical protein
LYGYEVQRLLTRLRFRATVNRLMSGTSMTRELASVIKSWYADQLKA